MMKKPKSPSKNTPKKFVTPSTRARAESIQFDLDPELAAFAQAFAAERDMSAESFAGMVVCQYDNPTY